ncbi:hypothetical protein SNOG_20005 [Parastagonospora nodorum SN15]|uniref:Malate synthase TIM barrel domain-containing protein n=1 Tax=Phaeosphaeria nodorum (strain SN15 / ATCC MYA-4574 / FGSC 10173) TaxID=321614 RepID=A9JTZ9_PHANO|nr:hypothetical protein SNOG_20005 [Parastagonospora nodorum SN15]EDP89755.1 hypothetical protein SNOG_20005 [Parastagonospora nodorum SN15]
MPDFYTLIAHVRGWHLEDKQFTAAGEPILGGLFDFGLYFFFNNTHEPVDAELAGAAGPHFNRVTANSSMTIIMAMV